MILPSLIQLCLSSILKDIKPSAWVRDKDVHTRDHWKIECLEYPFEWRFKVNPESALSVWFYLDIELRQITGLATLYCTK